MRTVKCLPARRLKNVLVSLTRDTVVHQVKLAMKLEMNCYVLLSTLYAIHHANESVLSAIFELKDK